MLSYYPIRNDWDREHPASGVKNLAARYQVIEGFKKLGLDVVSEELRYAMHGTLIRRFENDCRGARGRY